MSSVLRTDEREMLNQIVLFERDRLGAKILITEVVNKIILEAAKKRGIKRFAKNELKSQERVNE